MNTQSIQLKIAMLAGGCLLCAVVLLSALSFLSAQRSQDLGGVGLDALEQALDVVAVQRLADEEPVSVGLQHVRAPA